MQHVQAITRSISVFQAQQSSGASTQVFSQTPPCHLLPHLSQHTSIEINYDGRETSMRPLTTACGPRGVLQRSPRQPCPAFSRFAAQNLPVMTACSKADGRSQAIQPLSPAHSPCASDRVVSHHPLINPQHMSKR